MSLNYAKDVRIDESALDVEWLEQGEIAIEYGKELARLRKKVSILDEKVKIIRSELINKAYANPEKLPGGKVNMQVVEAYYRTHKKHKAAKDELIEAQHELDMAEIAKNEMTFTRKTALENLVKLHIAAYFAGPNVPRDLTKIRQDREKRTQEANEMIPSLKRKKKDKKNKKK